MVRAGQVGDHRVLTQAFRGGDIYGVNAKNRECRVAEETD